MLFKSGLIFHLVEKCLASEQLPFEFGFWKLSPEKVVLESDLHILHPT